MRNHYLTILLSFLVLLPGHATAESTSGIDDDSGLPYWSLTEGNLELKLIQRLPDQTRAFFQGRGFYRKDADRIASSCVFQTIIRNRAPGGGVRTVKIDLADWRVYRNNRHGKLILHDQWQKLWEKNQIDPAARTAFRWAMFPDRQEFYGGDYNWGMISFGLKPGDRFTLTVIWQEGNQRRSGKIKNLRCAPDKH
jgi:hypothetical protein